MTFAWHITRGHYGSTKLDGPSVAALFHSSGRTVKGPKWNAALHLDSRANPEQAEALGKMFSGLLGVVRAALLLAAGTWQLTRTKEPCLTHCESPLDFVMQHRRSGRRGAWRMGLGGAILLVHALLAR